MRYLTALLVATLFTVAGCNTMAGFGKDVEKTGDKIEDSANRKK